MSIARKLMGARKKRPLLVSQEFVGTRTGFRATDYSFSVTTSSPSAGRELYAAIPLTQFSGTDVIGVTFGGAAMTEVYQATNGLRGLVSFWKISDDVTTSATLTVDVDNTGNHIGESVAIYSVYNANPSISNSAVTSSLTYGDVSLSISANAEDCLIWCYATRVTGGSLSQGKITASAAPLTVTESYNADLNTFDWQGAGFIQPDNMDSSLSLITRTLSSGSGTIEDAVFGAIVLTGV